MVIDTGPTETRQNKPLFRVDDGVRPKNNLTEPALLEMSGNATYQDLGRRCDKFATMRARKLRIGDKVKVIGIPTLSISKELENELGTTKLFKYMLGRVYTIRGFDEYGHVELHPKRLSHVWIEREFLKLRTRKPNKA